ncbi:MAG: hypothetical protein HONBIEJF_02851 [Fimbriimonadaceae bacterium]|nr:hypothetical protein [Fimbriimonadaceae bacterium]
MTSGFTTGGTLRNDDPSYVVRPADSELFTKLMAGEFCFVLTSRQMGKSSMMVRTAVKLRQNGRSVAILDLTAIGQNLTVEQWYDGLLIHLGDSLGLTDLLEDYWHDNQRVGPLQRFFGAIEAVLLADSDRELVIFIDEIDAVRSLPFPTDEFFAAIRECHNRRALEPTFERLTFCLLGVASPGDLMQDVRRTPFNVGTRILLEDFSTADVQPLAHILDQAGRSGNDLIHRILHWTKGHPYLTQRLCREVCEHLEADRPGDVDRLCEQVFLSKSARETDDNLAFVRNRILKGESDPSALLDLYARVLKAKPAVRDDESNPLVSALHLAGIVRTVDGSLAVRNPVYARVFDRSWVEGSLPDAERLRQQAAYRQGLVRAWSIAGLIFAIFGALAIFGGSQYRERVASSERAIAAETQRKEQAKLIYALNGRLIEQAYAAGNLTQAQELLDLQRPKPGEPDLRGLEWRLLYNMMQSRAERAFPAFQRPAYGVTLLPSNGIAVVGAEPIVRAFTADGQSRKLADLEGAGTAICSVPAGIIVGIESGSLVRLSEQGKPLGEVAAHDGGLIALVGSGNAVASAGKDRYLRTWDSKLVPKDSLLLPQLASCLAVTSTGDKVAAGDASGSVEIWRTDDLQRLARAKVDSHVWSIAFSGQSDKLAVGLADGTVIVLRVSDLTEVQRLKSANGLIQSLAFHPSGKWLVAGCFNNAIEVWDLGNPVSPLILRGHKQWITQVAVAPNGTIYSSARDGMVLQWKLPSAPSDAAAKGHQSFVLSVALSPDRAMAATCGQDGMIVIWDPATRTVLRKWKGHDNLVWDVAFSPDGKLLASGGQDGAVAVHDPVAGKRLKLIPCSKEVGSVRFLPNGRLFAACDDGIVREIDATRGAIKREFPISKETISCIAAIGSERLLGGDTKGDLYLIDIAAGKSPRKLSLTQDSLNGLAISPDQKSAVVGSVDAYIRLIDLERFEIKRTFKGHNQAVVYLAWSTDGSTIASASMDKTVKLWRPDIEYPTLSLNANGFAFGVAMSLDGSLLAAVGEDGRLHVWEAAAANEMEPVNPSVASGLANQP